MIFNQSNKSINKLNINSFKNMPFHRNIQLNTY
nr:MAG TPA: hypothetical protein [Caudoviricetes sp.]